jgi:hypothetical protein
MWLPNSPRGGGDVPSATPGNGGGAPTNKVAPAIVQNETNGIWLEKV